MIFADECSNLTDKRIPKAWKDAVQAEKTTELLVYHLITQCLETFSHVYVELEANSAVVKILRSWEEREDGFGKNAIYLFDSKDRVILGCKYDIYQLNKDLQMFVSDLFGTLDPEAVSDDILFSGSGIPDGEIVPLISSIQKKIGVKPE